MNKVHELIKRSVNKIVDPIKVTLGPKGKTVAYTVSSEFHNIKPLITKDGATVAINIMSNDKYENQIISIVREGSIQTMLSSGDGTTTTAILIQALINKGYELIEEGISFYDLSRAFDKALIDVKEYINDNSINVETNEKLLRDIASISSNDEKIGNMLYDLIKEIGVYGDIDVRTSMLEKTSIEKHFGMKLNQGWMDIRMINNDVTKEFNAKDCAILIYNGYVNNINRILPYIRAVQYKLWTGQPLLILCEGIAEIAKKEIITQIQTGSQICMVELDLILYKRQTTVSDLACITGATVIDDKYDISNNMDLLIEDLGFSDDVLVTSNSCTLTGDLSNEQVLHNIEARIEDIKERLEYDDLKSNTELSNLQRKYHKKRLAGFTGGVATIMIGGNTQVEIGEIKDRYDDAVLAIQAALKNGVSYGGGYTYLNCVKHLKNKIDTVNNVNKDCYDLVLSSLETPFKELLKNGDIYSTYETLKSEILNDKVYDLRTNTLIDIKDTNIFDPTKVLIDALENAISVAKNLLSIKDVMYEGVLYE